MHPTIQLLDSLASRAIAARFAEHGAVVEFVDINASAVAEAERERRDRAGSGLSFRASAASCHDW
jgi:hypothetical protein